MWLRNHRLIGGSGAESFILRVFWLFHASGGCGLTEWIFNFFREVPVTTRRNFQLSDAHLAQQRTGQRARARATGHSGFAALTQRANLLL